MNRRHSGLERLIKCARHAPELPCPSAPPGFAARTVHQWRSSLTISPVGELRRVYLVSVWASVVLIVAGAAVLLIRGIRPSTPYDFTASYRMVAKSLQP